MENNYTEKDVVINGETFGENTVAMLLYGNIDVPNPDGTPSINSTEFVKEMNYLNSIGKHVVVKINSNGGSVYGGLAIMEAIEDNGADTYVVGMAGSIAGVILQAGKQRFANKRSSWMAHAPSSANGQASKKHINIVRDTLKSSLTNRSVLDAESIEKIMNGKEELYYSAYEMYDNGLVDKVIESGIMVEVDSLVNLTGDEIYLEYDKAIKKVALDSPNINNTNNLTMENLMSHLGLENKTENDVINIVKELESKATKVDELESMITNLKEENETLKNEAKELVKEQATVLINSAIESGKIKEEAKEAWIEQAMINMALTTKTLEALNTSKTAPVVLNNFTGGNTGESVTDTKKDYEWYLNNDPAALNNMYEENREQFLELEKAWKNSNNILN